MDERWWMSWWIVIDGLIKMSRWIKNYQKYYGNIIKRINKSLKVQDVYQILPDSLVSELDRNCLCVFVRGFCPFISWMGCIYPMEAGVGREIKRERARGILGRYPTKHSSPPPSHPFTLPSTSHPCRPAFIQPAWAGAGYSSYIHSFIHAPVYSI